MIRGRIRRRAGVLAKKAVRLVRIGAGLHLSKKAKQKARAGVVERSNEIPVDESSLVSLERRARTTQFGRKHDGFRVREGEVRLRHNLAMEEHSKFLREKLGNRLPVQDGKTIGQSGVVREFDAQGRIERKLVTKNKKTTVYQYKAGGWIGRRLKPSKPK